MRTNVLQVCLVAGLLAAVSPIVSAQQVIHAAAGTIQLVNPKTKTIDIKTDDGSEGEFKAGPGRGACPDKTLSADTVVTGTLSTVGHHMIVYYFGGGQERTAVALCDLGKEPLDKTTGTIVRFDKHGRLLTIRNSAGTEVPFHIDNKTVAEAAMGAVTGDKYDAEKGNLVRVTLAPGSGVAMALFIAQATN